MTSQISIDEITVNYADRGSGPPLLLLHGGLSAGVEWAPLVSRLSGTYRVITPDARGHGHSTSSTRLLSYELLADDVAALITALNLREPIVAGWSDGGQVALELAVRHPHVPKALIVGGALPDYVESGLRDRSRAILETLDSADEDFAELRALHDDWNGLVEKTRGMWLDYEGMSAATVTEIDVPVLVLAGDRDEIVDLERSVSLYRTLTHAELAVCPATTHETMASEARADLVAAVTDDFCRRKVHA